MSYYREVRVRPVVRYIVTYFESEDDDQGRNSSASIGYGTFDNAGQANIVGSAIADRERSLDKNEIVDVIFEPVRPLKIIWLRGPGEPQDAIRWELIEEGEPAPTL